MSLYPGFVNKLPDVLKNKMGFKDTGYKIPLYYLAFVLQIQPMF